MGDAGEGKGGGVGKGMYRCGDWGKGLSEEMSVYGGGMSIIFMSSMAVCLV